MERLDCDRMFVAVLETGSFAKAALLQRTSSGQASKLVSKLEADLGVQLLKRTTRSLSPTEVRRAYFERVKPLLEDFAALDASVRNASGTASGRLRISVPMSFGTAQLSPVLIAFAEAYPDIQLEVSFSDRIVNLIDEGFDLSVRIGAPSDSSLIGRKVCDMRIVVVAAPGYLAAHGEPLAPEALTSRDCIIDTNFREPLLWRFRGRDDASSAVTVAGRLRFSNAEACLAAAEAGLGIARAPSFMAGSRLRAGVLKPLLRAYEARQHGVFAIYPAGRHLATKVRVLVDFLAERFRGEPTWDQGW
jgi:DNA-binding transcriptional LysR family regulator